MDAEDGIQQFWVVFFLFFMTGIAIVLYLNQPPGQPRERDYAFAGSFYAFAIWIGLGVPAIYAMVKALLGGAKKAKAATPATDKPTGTDWAIAGVAFAIGIFVPLQMVSQTWDDHDRSGRYTARDFGMNYLNSLEDNAIIFVNGDNDTFPLWYAQEVEGVRTDVKVVNLSYLSQDWYARQVAAKSYDAEGVPFYMPFTSMDYGNTPFFAMPPGTEGTDFGLSGDVTAKEALIKMYEVGKITPSQATGTPATPGEGRYFMVGGPNIDRVYVPVSLSTLSERFKGIPEAMQDSTEMAEGDYHWDITPYRYLKGGSASQFANLLAYDIIARSASEEFKRPVYFASTVGDSYYMGFRPNMFHTGMALQVTPYNRNGGDASPVAAKAYENIVGKFRWGGLDAGRKVYLDETVRRMVSSVRIALIQVVNDLLDTPDEKAPEAARKVSKEKGLPVPATYADMASDLMLFMEQKMPTSLAPYENGLEYEVGKAYMRLGEIKQSVADYKKAIAVLEGYVNRTARLMAYARGLDGGARIGFMRNETRNMYYAMTALSMISMADLEIAALDGKIDSVNLSPALIDMMTAVDGLDYQMLFFLGQPTAQDLVSYGTVGEDLTAMLDLYSKAGIDPFARVNNFVKAAGTTPEAWAKMMR